MKKQERIWCFWYGVILAGITTIPYLIGMAVQGDEWHFTGFVFGVEDGNSYIAKMLLGQIGDWLFRTPYSTEIQNGVIAFLPYLLLGKLAAPPELHIQLVVQFHIFRVLCISFTVWVMYQFVSIYLEDLRWRRWATVLATIGGGLGWVVLPLGGSSWLGSLPLEWISPESFGFLSFYGLPHLILARGLLFLAVILFLRAEDSPRWSWLAGCVILLLLLVQPLSVLTLAAVIGAYNLLVLVNSLLQRKPQIYRPLFFNTLRMMVPPLPLFAYFVYSFSTDPFLTAWTGQNQILSPHPLHYLLAYGLMIPFLIVPFRKRVWKTRLQWLLPIGWLVAGPLLAYFPHNLQRRLPEGIWVAIIALAALGMAELWRRRPWGKMFVSFSIACALISSALLLIGGMQAAAKPDLPIFRPDGEVRAFQELERISPQNSIILASYNTGNALPAWGPVRVLVGHGPESANLDELLTVVSAFFSEEWDAIQRGRFLEEQQVDFIIYGPFERELGGWDPDSSSALILRYNENGYRIYEVSLSP
ncbi:MAG: hypothetical protein E3J30_10365 [Anaerolineales bacterium]|nr:MAG: hypothetical protein E3J30_10365 [Anaerolineales bacterium]